MPSPADTLTARVAAASAAVAFVVGYALAAIPTPCWLAPPAALPAPAHPPAKAAALDGWRVRSVRPTAAGHEADLVGPGGETRRVPADGAAPKDRSGPPRDPLLYGP